MQDKLEKERNDAKNAVEECVYEFRDKLCGPYEKFICEQVHLALLAGLSSRSACAHWSQVRIK